jgi:glycosyltransferase involved in cell wall biosynthesis
MNNSNIDLVLAGGLGWRYKGILKLIESSRVSEQIKLTGYVTKEEKMNLYAAAKAFLFPSHYEGFGVPILEAMAAGTVVITAKNSSLPEVAGDAALYIEDENDVNALAMQMDRVLGMSNEERHKWIEAGKGQSAKFSWEKCAEETWIALKSVR